MGLCNGYIVAHFLDQILVLSVFLVAVSVTNTTDINIRCMCSALHE